MKKQNISKLLLSLFMVFTITLTNSAIPTFPQENSSHIQLFAEDSPYRGFEEE